MAPRQMLLSCFALVFSLLLTSLPAFGTSEGLSVRRKAITFGTPPSNALDSRSLVKRVGVVSWSKALQRGQASVCLLAETQPASQWTQFAQLTQYGWNQDNTIGSTDIPPSDLSAALSGNQLSTSAAQWQLSYMLQDGEFPTTGGRNGFPTFGYYENVYNPSQGAIIATQNFGPAFQDSSPNADLPALQNWSDVVWLVWANICNTANTNPNSIQYFFRWHVNNDSGTQDLINQALGGADNLHAWPGTKIMTSTENGQALLGSAHGYGIVYFLKQHQATLGKKTVDYITAFQTTTGEYSLMFHITDAS